MTVHVPEIVDTVRALKATSQSFEDYAAGLSVLLDLNSDDLEAAETTVRFFALRKRLSMIERRLAELEAHP